MFAKDVMDDDVIHPLQGRCQAISPGWSLIDRNHPGLSPASNCWLAWAICGWRESISGMWMNSTPSGKAALIPGPGNQRHWVACLEQQRCVRLDHRFNPTYHGRNGVMQDRSFHKPSSTIVSSCLHSQSTISSLSIRLRNRSAFSFRSSAGMIKAWCSALAVADMSKGGMTNAPDSSC